MNIISRKRLLPAVAMGLLLSRMRRGQRRTRWDPYRGHADGDGRDQLFAQRRLHDQHRESGVGG